jgi:hydrogenase 3 maturation protease
MRVAVCGIGNRIRGDDGVGPEVISALKPEIGDSDVLLFDCEINPESLLARIEDFSPDKLIVIDAVDMGGKPGSVGVVDIHSVKKQAISTHKLPLSMFIDYLQNKMRFKLIFIGIQPKEIGFNKSMSDEVRKAIPLAKELVLRNI